MGCGRNFYRINILKIRLEEVVIRNQWTHTSGKAL
jgi:hypothetical protein